MDRIKELNGILADLKNAQERFIKIVDESHVAWVDRDQFKEKMSDLAEVVGDAIGRETVSQYF